MTKAAWQDPEVIAAGWQYNSALALAWQDEDVVADADLGGAILDMDGNVILDMDGSPILQKQPTLAPMYLFSGLQLLIDVTNTWGFWQPSNTSGGNDAWRLAERADTDGDLVGLIQDPSPCYLAIGPLGDGRRPTLRSGSDSPGYLDFGNATTNLLVDNSKKLFTIHETCIFGLGIQVRMAAGSDDTGDHIFLDNNSGSATNPGFYLARTSANVVSLLITRTGGTVVTATSTVFLKVTDGLTKILAWGDGTHVWLKIGSHDAEQYNVGTLAPANTDVLYDLSIGASANTLTSFGGFLADLFITNITLSPSDQAAYLSYVPGSRVSINPARALVAGDSLLPTQVSNLAFYVNTTDPTTLWQNVAKSLAVTVDGNPVRVASNLAQPAGMRLNRDMVAPSDGVRPLYKTNVEGVVGAVKYDGVSSELDFSVPMQVRGSWTVIGVFRNLDATNGSRVLGNASGQYLALAGSNYVGNTAGGAFNDGKPYCALHGPDDAIAAQMTNLTDAVNLYDFRNDGAHSYANVNGNNLHELLTGLGDVSWVGIGPASGNPLWWFDGYLYALAIYNTILPDSLATKVRLGLASLCNVPNVV